MSAAKADRHNWLYWIALVAAILVVLGGLYWRISTSASRCPDGYVLVPHNPEYVSVDFCVAKYEMKEVSGRPQSLKDWMPWFNVSRDEAITLCARIGAGYHLLNNYEWQNIARDIERTAVNWSGGMVGHGDLNVGNYSIEKGAAASDVSPCLTPGYPLRFPDCDVPGSAAWGRKRTHMLSNGEIIWDLGGNFGEWLSTDMQEMTTGPRALTCNLTGAAKYLYGPEGDYRQECTFQRGFGYLEGTGSAVIWRGLGAGAEGSPWENARGIFYANTNSIWSADMRSEGLSFRCAYISPGTRVVFRPGISAESLEELPNVPVLVYGAGG